MVKIKTIDLDENQLECLPKEFCNLPSDAQIDLFGNPLTSPPFDVCLAGMPSIKSYFQSLEGDTAVKRTKRTKMIIHGESQSGKSSLLRAILKILTGTCAGCMCQGRRQNDWHRSTQSQSERCGPCRVGLWWSTLLLTHQSTFHQQQLSRHHHSRCQTVYSNR